MRSTLLLALLLLAGCKIERYTALTDAVYRCDQWQSQKAFILQDEATADCNRARLDLMDYLRTNS